MKNKRLISIALAISLGISNFITPISSFAQQESASYESGVSYEQMTQDFLNQSVQEQIEVGSDVQTYTISAQKSENYVYLSDIQYQDGSKAGWGNIQQNKNTDGGKISLIINGTRTYFEKGMGAHAASTIIYDISALSDEYTVLSAYMGVDYSKNGKSDGVNFSVFTADSLDGQWTQVGKTTDTLRPQDEAFYFEESIKGANYLKLVSSVVGSTASDHSVYGDLRLLKEGYDISSELYSGVKTLAQYDEEISQYTPQYNFDNNKLLVLQREFVNRVGYQNIQTACKYNENVKPALDWLLNDEESLHQFIEAGGYLSGSGLNVMNALGNLYAEHSEDLSNPVYKKMMLATAAAYCRTIKSFMVNYGGGYIASDPVRKYEEFKKLYDEGRFIRQEEFENYPMELVRAVMDSKAEDSEFAWVRDMIDAKFPDVNNTWRYNGYGYVSYVNTGYGNDAYYDQANKQKYNDKYYNFSDYGVGYGLSENGSKIYHMWMMMDAGGICWGISNFGMVVNEVQGVAAVNTYQPGHEAYLLYSKNSDGKGIWTIWNNVGNWHNSYTRWGSSIDTEARLPMQWGQMDFNRLNGGYNTTYILLAQDALNDYENYIDSMYWHLISNSYPAGSENQQKALEKSLECYNKNLDAVYGFIKSYKANQNTAQSQWMELAHLVIDRYTFFPGVMVDLLNLITPYITDDAAKAEINILKTQALNTAAKATPQQSLQNSACQNIAQNLLGDNAVELASFSFSGENANTIVLHPSYDEVNLAVRVSLDGGNTWLKFEEGDYTYSHKIKLTDQQIKSVTAQNDIVVGLIGTDATYTIDIKEGRAITNLQANDNENLLLGDNANLEYSLDGGLTWKDYESGLNSTTRFEGDVTVLCRYKAHDTYLLGVEKEFYFTQNTDPDTDKYLQLQYVTLTDYSSQQSTGTDHAAKNFIDGKNNTAWHTQFNKQNDGKYYTVKFSDVEYITKLTYLPAGQNGRLKSGQIYTSMDGENWTLAHTFENLANNTDLKTIQLQQPAQAKYLKIAATETYYNSIGEKNMYFSGKMLNFYTDTTMEYNPVVEIKYSTQEATKEAVTATLVLPEGFKAEQTEYVFTKNGRYTFVYTDVNGTQKTIEAVVSWIIKDEKQPHIEFSEEYWTNAEVTAVLENAESLGENIRVIAEYEDAEAVFPIVENPQESTENNAENNTENSTQSDIQLESENISQIQTANINSGSENGQTEQVLNSSSDSSKETLHSGSKADDTAQDTLNVLSENSNIISNDNISENNSDKSIINDIYVQLNKDKLILNDDNLNSDKNINILNDINIDKNSNINILNVNIGDQDNENGNINTAQTNKVIFKNNGWCVFRIYDGDVLVKEVKAEVNWIDKTKPADKEIIKVSETDKNTFTFNSDNVEIISVKGGVLENGQIKVDKNGEYLVTLKLKSTGYQFEYTVKVDWLTNTDNGNNSGNNGTDNGTNNGAGNSTNNTNSNTTNNNSNTNGNKNNTSNDKNNTSSDKNNSLNDDKNTSSEDENILNDENQQTDDNSQNNQDSKPENSLSQSAQDSETVSQNNSSVNKIAFTAIGIMAVLAALAFVFRGKIQDFLDK